MPAREGMMPIPSDLENKLRAAAAVAEQELVDAGKMRQADAEAELAAARKERDERRSARPAARAIWAWVSGPEARRLRQLSKAAALPDLDLTGTVWANGEPSPGLHTGCWSIALCARKVALRSEHRFHPMGGRQLEFRSATEIAKVLPSAVVFRLARDLESGAVWDRLRRDVTNVGALVRRWRDEEELRLVSELEREL